MMRTVQSILVLFLIVALCSCLQDGPFKEGYMGYAPSMVEGDGIELSTPENENIDRGLLEEAYKLVYSDDRYVMARSLLVFRNGKLIAEAYPDNPKDIGAIHNIQSCTKSITSIVTGIAVREKWIGPLNEKLIDIYPEFFDSDQRKYPITIEDALTMRTGLEFDNGKHTLELYRTKENSVGYVLSQEFKYPPGLIVNYNDGAPQLISKVIERKTGMLLSEYANEKLFKPLGISNWKWEAAEDGSSFGAFSLYLKPRDFGKIGQLLLQNGKWGSETIIDSVYLAEATSIKVSANFHHEPYGYYFWILPAYGGYAALGHGGQFLLVVPQKGLVVVYTAWPYTSDKFFDQRNDLMALIINSCK